MDYCDQKTISSISYSVIIYSSLLEVVLGQFSPECEKVINSFAYRYTTCLAIKKKKLFHPIKSITKATHIPMLHISNMHLD